MKKSIVIMLVWTGGIIQASAQVPAPVKKEKGSVMIREKINPLHSDLISLTSESNHQARMGSDVYINSLDSLGSNPLVHSNKLNADYTADIPKNAYGFANGRLILRGTGATSSGTITGSGVVGTGSSLGNIGSTGSGIGLNGKTPDAGSGMWGNARGFISIPQEKKISKQ